MFVKIRMKYNAEQSWKSTLSKILWLVSSGFGGGDFKLNLVHHSDIANVWNVLEFSQWINFLFDVFLNWAMRYNML